MTSDVFGVLCFHDLLILDRGIIIGTSNSLSTSHTPLICSFNVTLVGSWPRLTSSNYLLYSSVESIKTGVLFSPCIVQIICELSSFSGVFRNSAFPESFQIFIFYHSNYKNVNCESNFASARNPGCPPRKLYRKLYRVL